MTPAAPRLPPAGAIAELLDTHATFAPPPLVPEVRVFQASSLVDIWAAAEALTDDTLPSPFWAYAWPAGIALARVLLDRPDDIRGRRVLDFGAGGGVASLAAARAGAAHVVANDIDPWAAATVELAAQRQGLHVQAQTTDLTTDADAVSGYDVVLASDLAYERQTAPHQRALLERARDAGATVLIADAGRTYFDERGLEPVAAFTIPVPVDLEGVAERTARVYRMT